MQGKNTDKYAAVNLSLKLGIPLARLAFHLYIYLIRIS